MVLMHTAYTIINYNKYYSNINYGGYYRSYVNYDNYYRRHYYRSSYCNISQS